jgi:hypothetical protein
MARLWRRLANAGPLSADHPPATFRLRGFQKGAKDPEPGWTFRSTASSGSIVPKGSYTEDGRGPKHVVNVKFPWPDSAILFAYGRGRSKMHRTPRIVPVRSRVARHGCARGPRGKSERGGMTASPKNGILPNTTARRKRMQRSFGWRIES